MITQHINLLPLMAMMFLFPLLKTPMSMGGSLVIITLLMALAISSVSSNAWLYFMLVMIFIGGLLVIFIYMALLSPNETFKFNLSNLFSILMFTFMLSLSIMMIKSNTPSNMFNFTSNKLNSPKNMVEWLQPLYSTESFLFTLYLILYLLLTLIIVVFVTKTSKLALRSQS